MIAWEYISSYYRCVREIDKALTELLQPLFEEHEINTTHFNLLQEVVNTERLSMSSLAEKMSKASANVTPIVSKMEEKGLITRRHSEADRRTLYVEATDKGIETINEIHKEIDYFYNELYKIKEVEILQLLPFLENISEMIKKTVD